MSEEQLIQTPCVFGENGNFLLERELGRGGMGGVYMGRDKMLDRPVAVKVMLKEYGSDPEFVEKFKREAQAAARLIHPNIAQVYSYGFSEGMPYIAMELVAGGSLDKLMQNSGANIDVPRVMKICEQVAQALRCAADQGLVHGDVKPENVLLDANGNAKLVDFGLAAMQKDTDEIWGTPYYIAPEKVRKEAVDYRADMYSLGGTIYHAITGVAPFEGDDAVAVVRKRFEGAPRKPSEVRPGISPQIDYLVMKMLAANPADRYPSFEALLEDFKKVMTTGLSMTGPVPDSKAHSGSTGRITGATRRMTLKKRPPSRTGRVAADEGEGLPSPRATAKLRTAKISGFSANLSAAAAPEEEPEEEGGVGGKVALAVGGVVAVIALVVGGLVWFQAADRKARERETQMQLDSAARTLRSSLENTKSVALKFSEKTEAFAAEAVKECDDFTTKLRQALSAQYAESVLAQLKPPPTAELLKARAAVSGEAPAEAPAASGAAAQKPAPDAGGGKAFPAPVGEECDPNSPEGQRYAERKAKWRASHGRGGGGAAASETPVAAQEEGGQGATDAEGKIVKVPQAVTDVAALWLKAYECETVALHTKAKVAALVADIDKALAASGSDKAYVDALSDANSAACRRFEEIKASDEVSGMQSAKGVISGRGSRLLNTTVKDLYKQAKEREREEAKRKREEEERLRKERLAQEKAERIARETEAARAAFDGLVAAGKVRQLDWKGACRILDGVEAETAEGKLVLKAQKAKVDGMKLMHDTLIRNMKGYTFTRKSRNPKENLGGAVVKAVDSSKITVVKRGQSRETQIPWQTFYKSYPNSLAEVIAKFIQKNEPSDGVPKLSKIERFDAIAGVTFIMRIICSENAENPTAAATAISYGDKLMTDAVKEFPQRLPRAQEFFPDLKFDEALKDAAADEI